MRALLVVLSLAACGDDDGPIDAPLRDAEADADQAVIVPPTEAAAPLLTPCGEGFREIDACGVPACDPFPEGGRQACDEAEAHLVGTSGCAALGAACSEDFPDPPEGKGRVLYVRQGASGDGSRLAPFGDLRAAVASAPTGARILVAPGTYPGGLEARDVSIRGACPSATRIELADEDPRANVVTTGHVGLSGVTLAGGRGIFAPASADLRVEGVVVTRTQVAGIRVEGGALHARDLAIHSGIPCCESEGGGGFGIDATQGARVEVERAAIDGMHDAAIRADGEDTSVFLVRVVTSGTSGFRRGYGLEVSGGAQTFVVLSAFESNERYGVHVTDARSLLEISDSLIRDTRSSEPFGTLGHGIDHAADSRLVAHRVALIGNRGIGISVSGDDAYIDDTVVCDMHPARALGFWAAGIIDAADLSLTLRRVLVGRAQVVGIGVFNGARLDGEDLSIVDTTVDDFPAARSHALTVEFESVVRLARARVERAHDISLSVYESQLDAEDLIIRDTRPLVCDESCGGLVGGFGVGSYNGSRIAIERFSIEASPTCGLHIAEGGTATLVDGLVTTCGIGVCLQNPDQKLSALTDRVRYLDNGSTLDVTELPVPTPSFSF